MSKLHEIFCTCYLWRTWLVFLYQEWNTVCTSGFVHDVMFVDNPRGEGDANRAYTQRDSPGGRTLGEVPCYFLVALLWCCAEIKTRQSS